MEVVTKSARETQKLGENIAVSLIKQERGKRATVVTLQGELGSGKTTFVQGVTAGLGLPDRVVSPTFIVMKRYELKNGPFAFLYHLDLYRIVTAKEFDLLGFEEIFIHPDHLIIIEWAERLGGRLKLPDLSVNFNYTGENNRTIHVSDLLHDRVVDAFNNGGIAIFPTDTAFGIGTRIDCEKSIRRLYDIRRRPTTQAAPVLVTGIEMAKNYWRNPPPEVLSLARKHWPGGLTIVYAANLETSSPLVRGGGRTIGLRMPDHPTLLKLISRVGVPILAPSANFHKQQTPFRFHELDAKLLRMVDVIMFGECKTEGVSTVIDTSSKQWKILRYGSVPIKLKS